MTELTPEQWRERALRAENWIRIAGERACGTVDAAALREVDRMVIEDQQRQQQAEDARRDAERKAAQDAAVEEQRASAWFNQRLTEAQKSEAAFHEFLTGDLGRHRQNLPAGWPEGITPDAASAAAVVEEAIAETGNIAKTALGQMLIREGVHQGRVTVSYDKDGRRVN